MGFFDTFRPKYKHSDVNVRMKAVKELTDSKILLEVFKTDQHGYVKKNAIENPNFNYVDILEHIAVNGDMFFRESAIKNPNLTNQKLLAYIAINDESLVNRQIAIGKLNDEKTLLTIALKDSEKANRIRAIEKLKEEDSIVRVILHEKEWKISDELLKSIHKEESFIIIAYHADNVWIRRDACSRIRNEEALEYLALNDKDIEVNAEAIKHITNRKFLEDTLDNTAYEELQKYILMNPLIDDNVRLKYINTDDSQKVEINDIRYNAARSLSDEKLIADIALNTNIDSKLRRAAINNPNFNNQEILRKIAVEDEDKDIRIDAIWKIRDKKILSYIAEHDSFVKVTGGYMGDNDIVPAKTTYPIRDFAKKRLKELGYY